MLERKREIYKETANFKVDITLRAVRATGASEDILTSISNSFFEEYLVNFLQINDIFAEYK
jgi:hypothetical protein